jgi:hypothetical protein
MAAALDALLADGGLIWLEVRQRDDRLARQAEGAPRLKALLERLRGERRLDALRGIQAMGGGPEQPLSVSWTTIVADATLVVPTIKHIADVRRTANEPLLPPDLFRLAQASTRRTTGARREKWAETLERILRDVFGDDTRYEVLALENSGDFTLRIDGEDELPLAHAGAGVREVVAIAHAALTGDEATVLCIEEPGNCLHPNAVRRLLDSLVKHTEAQLFVTTHSAAVVNARPDAIVQLGRVGNTTTAAQVDRPSQQFEAIRALGYSPADLVLTPCVLWVEGPSDRLYLASWLRALGVEDGVDYEAMSFGGALGTHLTAAADVESGEALTAIRQLSRRCVIVTDSDRAAADAPLKRHVERFREELAGDEHGLHVVTWGREVENYLPTEIANKVRGQHGAEALPPAEGDYRYAKVIEPELNKQVSKVAFANQVLALLGGEIPPVAKEDVEQIAEFILASDPRRWGGRG